MSPTTDRRELESIRRYLEGIGQWRPEFKPMVEELVEFRRLRADAIARAQERPVVPGYKGQPRENPALSTALKLQEECRKLADALFLSPRAALRAGVQGRADPLDGLLGD